MKRARPRTGRLVIAAVSDLAELTPPLRREPAQGASRALERVDLGDEREYFLSGGERDGPEHSHRYSQLEPIL